MNKSSHIIQKAIYHSTLLEGEYHPIFAQTIDSHYKDKTPFILFDFSKKIDGISSAIYSFPKEHIDDLAIIDHSDYEYTIGLFNNLRNNTDSVLICFGTILSNFEYNVINDNFIEFTKGVKKLIEVNDNFQLIDFFRVNPDDAWFHSYFKNEAENAIIFWEKFINPMFSSSKVRENIYLLSNLASYDSQAINSPYLIASFNTNDINNSDVKWISELVLISSIHNAIENKQDINIYIIEDKEEIINMPYIYYISTEYYTKEFKGNIHLTIQQSDKRISIQSNPLINSKEKCDIICQISALKHGTKTDLLIKETQFRLGVSEWTNENNFKLISEGEIMNLLEHDLKIYRKDLQIYSLKQILRLWEKKSIMQRNKNEITQNEREKKHKLKIVIKDEVMQAFIDDAFCGTYIGEIKDGKPHGKGKLVTSIGKIYNAIFINGEIDGDGSIHFPDGSEYSGGLKGSEPHGFGKFNWSNGNTYEGEWVNGKKHGFGKQYYNNKITYEGQWNNSTRDGLAKILYENRIYETFFIRGAFNPRFVKIHDFNANIIKNEEVPFILHYFFNRYTNF